MEHVDKRKISGHVKIFTYNKYYIYEQRENNYYLLFNKYLTK